MYFELNEWMIYENLDESYAHCENRIFNESYASDMHWLLKDPPECEAHILFSNPIFFPRASQNPLKSTHDNVPNNTSILHHTLIGIF